MRVLPEVGGAVKWLASIVSMAADLNPRQTAMVALELQEVVNEGRLKGKLVTGDHDEDGKTVWDWEDFE